jgi:hypothetical protein
MKYGSAIHVAMANEEFKTVVKLLRLMKSVQDTDY